MGQDGTAPGRAWRLAAVLAAAAVGLPAATGTLLGFLGRAGWALDLFSHFRVQYLYMLAASMVFLVMARRYRLATLPAALAALNLALVVPVYWGGAHGPAGTPTYRLLAANIHGENRETGKVRDLLVREHPDVVILTEFTPRWMGELADLNEAYAFRVLQPRDSNFGIAVFSRLPIDVWQPLQTDHGELLGVRVVLSAAGRPVTLIAVHTMLPLGSALSRLRNRQLKELGALAAGTSTPVLLAGDFNLTPWSPYFSDLLAASGLRDSRRGFGIQATWPAGRGPMRIPIDHCLASAGIRIVDRRVGADTGSDHLPIIVDFALSGE